MPQHPSGPAVPYMERTRAYYRALGYDNDYVWARSDDVPFTRPRKPLRVSRVALITTAGPADRSNRDAAGRKQVWSCPVASPPAAFDTDLSWDKEGTHTEDREVFLPIRALQRLVEEGAVGSLAPRFHAIPTTYSQQATLGRDAPEILRRMWEDEVDAAILTAL